MRVGRVGRSHGLDGSFYVTRPRARMLTLGAAVTLAGRTAAIVRRAGTEQRPIVRIEGVEDREAAEALRGSDLTIDSRDAPRLQEGEWWAHELEGCIVVDGERELGTVQSMIELPSCEALEVLPTGGGAPLLIPMVKDAIRAVEPAARRIEVNAGFLEVSAAPAPAPEPGPDATPDATPDAPAEPLPDASPEPAPGPEDDGSGGGGEEERAR